MRSGKYILAIALLTAVFSANSHAATYYLSPSGDNANSGTATTSAWATLQYAQGRLGAGDTLLIMGGTYSDAQYMSNPSGGSPDNHVVVKAYGDEVAYFQRGGSLEIFFDLFDNADWFIIDGQSYLDESDPGIYLVFQPGAYDGMAINSADAVIRATGGSGSEVDHVTVNKIEASGLYCGHSVAPDDYEAAWLYRGFSLDYCRYWDITGCYIHHIGDSTWTYGAGYAINYRWCRFIRIENCTITHSGHGCLEHGTDTDYSIIRNNVIANYWAGGIYVYGQSTHNLFEGNLVYHSGTAYGDGDPPDYPKPCVQLSSSFNVFRDNVFYTPGNQGFDLESASRPTYGMNRVDSNLVYNNTIYCSRWYYGTMMLQVLSSGHTCANNVVANNIIYRNLYPYFDVGTTCSRIPMVAIITGWSGGPPENNEFENNLIRYYQSTGSYDSAIVFNADCSDYSVAEVEALDPTYWHDNITDRPMFFSEDPETVGLFTNWWHLQQNSPCIDRGAIVNDWIGAYVESRYPGYGWGNRSYVGTAPDIGAFEFDGENQAPPGPPSLTIHPGRR